MQWQRGSFTIDTNPDRLDRAAIASWLRESYWASDRSAEAVRRSWDNAAVVFGLYDGELQIGCARVVSDCVSIAYPADVFVLPEYRGRGLGSWMFGVIVEHPDLTTAGWVLHTRDAHDLYRRFGFQSPGERLMERPRP
jgi:GNAT superfamily N-acetyltransferase